MAVKNRTTPRPTQTASVTIGLYWNEAAKAWDVRAEGSGRGVVTQRANTTTAFDHDAMQILVMAICREMEQWAW